MNTIAVIAAVIAFVVGAYSVLVIIDAAGRNPLDKFHEKFYADRQANYTILLIVCALVCGLAVEKVLP